MKVLFLYPLWTGDYKGISGYFAKRAGGTYIPYNLALLAAITEKAGHEAKIVDGELEKISLEEITKRTKEYNPDVVVLTGMTPFYNIAVECASMLKKVGAEPAKFFLDKVPMVLPGHFGLSEVQNLERYLGYFAMT